MTNPNENPENQPGNQSFGGQPYGGQPYGAPQPGYQAGPQPGYPGGMQQGYPGGAPGMEPDNNLVWSILCTVLCCLPLGIVAIIKSTSVSKLWAMGDYAGAQKAADDAKKFAMWGAIISVVLIILYILFFVVLGVAASSSSSY